MPQRVSRSSSRTTSRATSKTRKKTSASAGKAIFVKLGIMGDGVYEACVEAGKTSIAQLFEQVNADHGTELKPGEALRMKGRAVTPDTVITTDGAVITSTKAEGGA